MLTHKECGGTFVHWVAGGHFSYHQCDKCGHYLLEKDQEEAKRKVRRAIGNCRNYCCQPRRF